MCQESNYMNNQSFQLIPEAFKVVSKCPLCMKDYAQTDAKILEEDGENHLIYIRCSQCQGAIVALVVLQPIGVMSYGLVTDLTEEEVFKFRKSEPISEDFILQMYSELERDSSFIKKLNV